MCLNRYVGGGSASKPVYSLAHEAVMCGLLRSIVTRNVSVLNSIINRPYVTLWRLSLALKVTINGTLQSEMKGRTGRGQVSALAVAFMILRILQRRNT